MQEITDAAKTQAAEMRERWNQRNQEEIENIPQRLQSRLESYCIRLIGRICVNKVIILLVVAAIGGGTVFVWLKWYN
jgi:hypothetical protein